MSDQDEDAAYIDFAMHIEFFYPVLINVLYEPDVPTADLLTKEAWYSGTGFFYRIDGKDFLVSARHILSGRTWRENKLRLDHDLTPTHIRISLRGLLPPEGFDGAQLTARDVVLPLLEGDGTPRWLEHPDYRHEVDVAALPLAGLLDTDGFHYMPIEPEQPKNLERLWVTQDVFIIGFPMGLHQGYLWPLWIRGTIASEPHLNFGFKGQQYPMFLVDARTRSGQSGAPVFMLRRPFVEDVGDQPLPRTRFLGVYSGRANDEAPDPARPLPADLGFVWVPGELYRICRGSTRGEK